jgi:hypothetical protein
VPEKKTKAKKKYYSDDRIHEDKICRACSTYGGEEKCIEGFGGES